MKKPIILYGFDSHKIVKFSNEKEVKGQLAPFFLIHKFMFINNRTFNDCGIEELTLMDIPEQYVGKTLFCGIFEKGTNKVTGEITFELSQRLFFSKEKHKKNNNAHSGKKPIVWGHNVQSNMLHIPEFFSLSKKKGKNIVEYTFVVGFFICNEMDTVIQQKQHGENNNNVIRNVSINDLELVKISYPTFCISKWGTNRYAYKRIVTQIRQRHRRVYNLLWLEALEEYKFLKRRKMMDRFSLEIPNNNDKIKKEIEYATFLQSRLVNLYYPIGEDLLSFAEQCTVGRQIKQRSAELVKEMQEFYDSIVGQKKKEEEEEEEGEGEETDREEITLFVK